MSVTNKVHLVRQVMSSLCKGPVFDTVWSKVGLDWTHIFCWVYWKVLANQESIRLSCSL